MSSLLYALAKACYRRWRMVFALWLVGVIAGRGVKGITTIHLSPLLILWIVTLIHLAFWGPLAKLISW